MEGNTVHRPYMVFGVDGLSMALKRVFFGLYDLTGIEEFHRNSTFYRTRRVTYAMWVGLKRRSEATNGHVPSPVDMHATALVKNFKLLSLSCAGESIFLTS